MCDLTDPVGLSQPTVSHHLKQLTETGLITREQRGKWAYYRVVQLALATRDCPLREETGHLDVTRLVTIVGPSVPAAAS